MNEYGLGRDAVGKEGTQTYRIQIGCNKRHHLEKLHSVWKQLKCHEENKYRSFRGAIFCLTQYKLP